MDHRVGEIRRSSSSSSSSFSERKTVDDMSDGAESAPGIPTDVVAMDTDTDVPPVDLDYINSNYYEMQQDESKLPMPYACFQSG